MNLTPKQEKVVDYLSTRKGRHTSKTILAAVGGSYKALAADLKALSTAKILRRAWSANGHQYLYSIRDTGLIAALDDPVDQTVQHYQNMFARLIGRKIQLGEDYIPATAKLAWKFPLGVAGLYNSGAKLLTGELVTQTELDRYREYLIEYRTIVIELYQAVNRIVENSEAWTVETTAEYLQLKDFNSEKLESLIQKTQLVINELTPQN